MNNDELQKIFERQNYVVVQVGWAGKKGYRPSYRPIGMLDTKCLTQFWANGQVGTLIILSVKWRSIRSENQRFY